MPFSSPAGRSRTFFYFKLWSLCCIQMSFQFLHFHPLFQTFIPVYVPYLSALFFFPFQLGVFSPLPLLLACLPGLLWLVQYFFLCSTGYALFSPWSFFLSEFPLPIDLKTLVLSPGPCCPFTSDVSPGDCCSPCRFCRISLDLPSMLVFKLEPPTDAYLNSRRTDPGFAVANSPSFLFNSFFPRTHPLKTQKQYGTLS